MKSCFIVSNKPLICWTIISNTTINPARVLRIDDRKGSIEIGKDADLTVVDENNNGIGEVSINLKLENAVIDTQTTDETGTYTFSNPNPDANLEKIRYIVKISNKSSYKFRRKNNGSSFKKIGYLFNNAIGIGGKFIFFNGCGLAYVPG